MPPSFIPLRVGANDERNFHASSVRNEFIVQQSVISYHVQFLQRTYSETPDTLARKIYPLKFRRSLAEILKFWELVKELR